MMDSINILLLLSFNMVIRWFNVIVFIKSENLLKISFLIEQNHKSTKRREELITYQFISYISFAQIGISLNIIGTIFCFNAKIQARND